MALESVPNSLGQSTSSAVASSAPQALAFLNDPAALIAGVIFIAAAIALILFIKKILVNSILGVVAWAILTFVFQIKLPFWASLIVSVIFGLAGLGVLLILRFLGYA